MSKKFLYIVRTKSRIKLRIEASNAMEAEQRVRHPAIMRELALMLSSALSDVDSVEWCCVELHAHTNLLLFQSAVEQKWNKNPCQRTWHPANLKSY